MDNKHDFMKLKPNEYPEVVLEFKKKFFKINNKILIYQKKLLYFMFVIIFNFNMKIMLIKI